MRVTAEGAQKTGIYPYYSDNIVPGQKVLVKSAKHRKELMAQHGLQDARDWSAGSIAKKKRWHEEAKRKEKRERLAKAWKEVKSGRVDIRQAILAKKKREYELRNYGKVGILK